MYCEITIYVSFFCLNVYLFAKIELNVILFLTFYTLLLYILNLYLGPPPTNFLDPSLLEIVAIYCKSHFCFYLLAGFKSFVWKSQVVGIKRC
jgi:hypothetical protein